MSEEAHTHGRIRTLLLGRYISNERLFHFHMTIRITVFPFHFYKSVAILLRSQRDCVSTSSSKCVNISG